MEKVLIDTDVIIDFIRGYNQRINEILNTLQNKTITPLLSIVSIAEVYAGRDADDKEKTLTEFLSIFEIIGIKLETAKLAGRIKQKYSTSFTDGVIAATTIEQKASLFTFNTKHFHNISNLNLYKP